MFEHGPWKDCPACEGTGTLGVLTVGGNALRRRCKSCRHVETERLPKLDKAVIYLDQFAFSEIFKVAAGTRKPDAPHEEFWSDVNERVNRVLLLQQAVFPDSDLHSNETTVFKDAEALRTAMRRLGGEVEFHNTEDVFLKQVWAYVDGYIETLSHEPVLDFSIDDVLTGDQRNDWLPVLSIGVKVDYSQFAEGLRADREKIDEAMREITERWAKTKPKFEDVLKLELECYGQSHRQGYVAAVGRFIAAVQSGDPQALLAASGHPILVRQAVLTEKFKSMGFTDKEALLLVFDFWAWPPLQHQPAHKISAYLYAAIARKIAAGQKRAPTRGMMNDVTAIATYAPYVDAMFVDNECAALLREAPLPDALKLKARIFSLATREEFLTYLSELEARTPAEVRSYAEHLYGAGA